MFDVSLSELLVIAVVALIVIGPEKLPQMARTLGAITGRMQRYAAQIREEVNREARFEELQKLQQEMRDTSMQVEAETNSILGKAKQVAEQNTESIKDMTMIAAPKKRHRRQKKTDDPH